MKRTGLRFYIEGEYCKPLWHLPDPNDEDWQLFETKDINPFNHSHFTIWSQYDDPLAYSDERERIVSQAVAVIDWLRNELDWEGFCAKLWLCRGSLPDEAVMKWEIC